MCVMIKMEWPIKGIFLLFERAVAERIEIKEKTDDQISMCVKYYQTQSMHKHIDSQV